MKTLKLTFLDAHNIDKPNLIAILENYGKEIAEYSKDYFSYLITSGSFEGVLTDFALYIVVPEIGYDYRVINIEIIDISTIQIQFLTLITKQTEKYKIDISKGTEEFENKLNEVLSSVLFNASLRFLVEQVHLKRQYSDDIRGKIKIGEAKIATLKTGERINVGFQRIDGDEVIYYTGKGLRAMFKPDMTEEEKKQADKLKELTEEELIQNQCMARKNINDFKDIE